ncbi:MAG: hypothetical protein IBX56_20260 [Methylomicrobium sp.]|nr:hypothetical protein [Methylomicrobium sp.]
MDLEVARIYGTVFMEDIPGFTVTMATADDIFGAVFIVLVIVVTPLITVGIAMADPIRITADRTDIAKNATP